MTSDPPVTPLAAPPARVRHLFVVVRHEKRPREPAWTIIRLRGAVALYRVRSVDFLRVTCDMMSEAMMLEALEHLEATGRIK